MDARTPSRRNGRAWLSLAAGLLGVAAVPAGVALAETSAAVDLLDTAPSVAAAAVLGVAALVLSAGARERLRRTIGRVGGAGAARAGRILGRLALAVALSGAIALAFYKLLGHWSQ